jgi:azurin
VDITSNPPRFVIRRAFRRVVVPALALTLASSFLPLRLSAQAGTAKPGAAKPDAAKPDAAKPGAAAAQAGARTIEIVGSDDMKYDKVAIAAKPGEQIRIRLTAKGAMPKVAMAHNVVVLKLGTDAAAFVNAGITARATDYIAPANKASVIAATPLAGNGETVEITFKVPTAPGAYPFVCTFPGHFAAGMKGTLTVKK